MPTRRLTAVLAALFLVFPTFVSAQGTATSSISGVVVDSGESVVPGASITVKNESTGAEFFAVSGENGGFTVPSLNIGTYTVTVSLTGFKTAVLKGVTVSSGAPATVRPRLEVGGITENVVVQAASEVIQTQSAAMATLEAAGFKAQAFTVPAGEKSGIVVAQSPQGGIPAPGGSKVRLYVSGGKAAAGPPPPPAP